MQTAQAPCKVHEAAAAQALGHAAFTSVIGLVRGTGEVQLFFLTMGQCCIMAAQDAKFVLCGSESRISAPNGTKAIRQ